MIIESCHIEGVKVIKPRIFGDHRGYFFESYNQGKYEEIQDEPLNFVQDNESLSKKGTLRGLHFQTPPYSQAKLVRVVYGEVLDVAVDMRPDSPTFGQHFSIVLSGENKHQLFVPRGFAHGFVVRSDEALFAYKVDNIYAPDHDSGIMWSDPDLNIDWGLDESILKISEKDSQLISFEAYKKDPSF